MAIRVVTANDDGSIGVRGERISLSTGAGRIGAAAQAGNALVQMERRVEAAERERTKFKISNEADNQLLALQQRLESIRDPDEYKRVADEGHEAIQKSVVDASTDQDMVNSVTRTMGSRFRASQLSATGSHAKLVAEEAWGEALVSLDTIEKSRTLALANSGYFAFQDQIATLAQETGRTEEEIELRIRASRGNNSNERYYRDLALYREGGFAEWEKTVRSEEKFDALYPEIGASRRAEALNAIKTAKGNLFASNLGAAHTVITQTNNLHKISPLARIDTTAARTAVASAAATATTPAQRRQVESLAAQINGYEAFNKTREEVRSSGVTAVVERRKHHMTNPPEVGTPAYFQAVADEEFLSSFATAEKQQGSKNVAGQLQGGPTPDWNDPNAGRWAADASKQLGIPVNPYSQSEMRSFVGSLEAGNANDAAAMVQRLRNFPREAQAAFASELADEGVNSYQRQVTLGLIAFPVSPAITREAFNGVSGRTLPKISWEEARPFVEKYSSAFMVDSATGLKLDVVMMESTLAVAQAIHLNRGGTLDNLDSNEFDLALRQAMGLDENGNGGPASVNGGFYTLPQGADAATYENTFAAAPLPVLETFGNGKILQGEGLQKLRNGNDLLDAGVQFKSIGGGNYVLQIDQLRVKTTRNEDFIFRGADFLDNWSPDARRLEGSVFDEIGVGVP